MDKVSIVIAIASLGLIIMGLFIIKSKKLSSIIITRDNEDDTKKFIRKNGYINIIVGFVGLLLSCANILFKENELIFIIIFILTIFIAVLIQMSLASKLNN